MKNLKILLVTVSLAITTGAFASGYLVRSAEVKAYESGQSLAEISGAGARLLFDALAKSGKSETEGSNNSTIQYGVVRCIHSGKISGPKTTSCEVQPAAAPEEWPAFVW